MTVSYNLAVSSSSTFSFFKILFRWRGSIWKNVKCELILWTMGYYAIFYLHRTYLTTEQQLYFGKWCQELDKKLDYIPLTFMLGFFVTVIVDRWRQIFQNMGWIENAALNIAAMLRGNDDETILQRRSIIRYMVVSQILVYRDISLRVRRRFPTMESLVTAGFLHEHELKALDDVDTRYPKYWIPIHWSYKICTDAMKERKIDSPALFNNIIAEIRNFRSNLATLCNFDWVPIPIAYPQVVFLAVRIYFVLCLVSRQHFIHDDAEYHIINEYFPFMTMLQLFLFVGWMKVAESIINPLGEDDDDFECNFLIDKNICTGLAIVDQCYDACPEMKPDKFSESGFVPIYSKDCVKWGMCRNLVGSVAMVKLVGSQDEVKMVPYSPKESTLDLTNDTMSLRERISKKIRKSTKSVRPTSENSPCDRPTEDLELGEVISQFEDNFSMKSGCTKNKSK